MESWERESFDKELPEELLWVKNLYAEPVWRVWMASQDEVSGWRFGMQSWEMESFNEELLWVAWKESMNREYVWRTWIES